MTTTTLISPRRSASSRRVRRGSLSSTTQGSEGRRSPTIEPRDRRGMGLIGLCVLLMTSGCSSPESARPPDDKASVVIPGLLSSHELVVSTLVGSAAGGTPDALRRSLLASPESPLAFVEGGETEPRASAVVLFEVETGPDRFTARAQLRGAATYGGGWQVEKVSGYTCARYSAPIPHRTREDVVVEPTRCSPAVIDLREVGAYEFQWEEIGELSTPGAMPARELREPWRGTRFVKPDGDASPSAAGVVGSSSFCGVWMTCAPASGADIQRWRSPAKGGHTSS
jgi:hypothetical protein